MGARNQGGIGLSYRPARLHRLAESIPWNRFLGSINVLKIRAQYEENIEGENNGYVVFKNEISMEIRWCGGFTPRAPLPPFPVKDDVNGFATT